MTFRELLEMDVNVRKQKVEPKYKKLEAELKKLRTNDANFSVLNDVRGNFTLMYKVQDNYKNSAKKLADKGFKILKKHYPKVKELKSYFGRFPHEPTGYALEIEYNLGKINEWKNLKPSDFKKGDKVKWADAFNSRDKDKSGVVVGFKDHADYKNGYLVIKGTDNKEYKLIWSAVTKA